MLSFLGGVPRNTDLIQGWVVLPPRRQWAGPHTGGTRTPQDPSGQAQSRCSTLGLLALPFVSIKEPSSSL
jgi:hypothetical protein